MTSTILTIILSGLVGFALGIVTHACLKYDRNNDDNVEVVAEEDETNGPDMISFVFNGKSYLIPSNATEAQIVNMVGTPFSTHWEINGDRAVTYIAKTGFMNGVKNKPMITFVFRYGRLCTIL